ncbi:uncharacterized protein [Temnothorax nylanderi]|uniref:uncharacterized protein n=1 Tax=Temnothorax nylanderi TaxID=102681 RepID=UPI003A8C19EA
MWDYRIRLLTRNRTIFTILLCRSVLQIILTHSGYVRFDDDHTGKAKVILRLPPDQSTTRKGMNKIKIWMILAELQICPTSLEMINHFSAEAELDKFIDANRTLDIIDKMHVPKIKEYVEQRSFISKGVISDWPSGIPELWEVIQDKSNILKLERMYRQKWDPAAQKSSLVATDNITITFKSNKIRDLSVFSGGDVCEVGISFSSRSKIKGSSCRMQSSSIVPDTFYSERTEAFSTEFPTLTIELDCMRQELFFIFDLLENDLLREVSRSFFRSTVFWVKSPELLLKSIRNYNIELDCMRQELPFIFDLLENDMPTSQTCGCVGLRVRPFIPQTRQCFNCFRFGHTKTACKSETRCIVCGDKTHGHCEKPVCCYNCGGQHKSTFRGCPEHERNKSINMVMAYNNVSFHRALRIIEREPPASAKPMDRLANPTTWPELPVSRPAPPGEGGGRERSVRVVRASHDRNDVTRPRTREHGPLRGIGNYLGQFNVRAEDITRDKRGLAIASARNGASWARVVQRGADETHAASDRGSAEEIVDSILL